MRVSVFVGTSLDGFLARPNDALDFLDAGDGVPHGYDEFIATVDALVIGRKTFEVVEAFGQWPYGKRRVVVLSSRVLHLSKVPGTVERMSGAPAEIHSSLAAAGVRHVYLDGGVTIQRFLAAGLVDSLTITRVPVIIGEGIPLFGKIPADIRLRHVRTQQYAGGLVQTEYEVEK